MTTRRHFGTTGFVTRVPVLAAVLMLGVAVLGPERRTPAAIALIAALACAAVAMPGTIVPTGLSRALGAMAVTIAARLGAAMAFVVLGSRRIARSLVTVPHARDVTAAGVMADRATTRVAERAALVRALEDARTALRRRDRDLALMTGIVADTSAPLDRSQILARVRDILTNESEAVGGRVLVREGADDRLTVAERWGLPDGVEPGGASMSTAAFYCPSVVREGRVLVARDFREIPDLTASGLEAARPWWRGYACIPLTAGKDVRGALELFTAQSDGFSEERLQALLAVGRQIGGALCNTALLDQVRSTSERLRYLSGRLMEVRETEHRRLARELHDEIGQALTALKLNLQVAGRVCAATAAVPRLEDSVEIVDRVLTQVRSLFVELRPTGLDELGLMPALRSYLERQARRAGLAIEVVAGPPPERLPAEVETACYRLVQEAITNVIRHANARNVRVEICAQGAGIDLLVRDDGAGFDVVSTRRRAGHGGNLGLVGMEERAALLGGTVAVESAPGRGTAIRAHLPLTVRRPREPEERGGVA